MYKKRWLIFDALFAFTINHAIKTVNYLSIAAVKQVLETINKTLSGAVGSRVNDLIVVFAREKIYLHFFMPKT